MALIGTIRKKMGTLLLIFVGVALLSFILGDFLSSNQSFIMGSGDEIAVIAGEKVTYREFEAMVDRAKENYMAQSRQAAITEATTDLIREQVWGQLINEKILRKEYQALGLEVSKEELWDMVQGRNINPLVRQNFTDPQTGMFRYDMLMDYLKKMDQDPSGKMLSQWMSLEQVIKDERVAQKYLTLVRKGFYITAAQAKADYEFKNKTARIKYVFSPYAAIADKDVKVTDDDIVQYYDQHKNEYEQEASRKIEYVTFDVIPTSADSAEVQSAITQLLDEFKTTSNDSAFVNINSETKFSGQYVKKGSFAAELDSELFVAAPGALFGPYIENGSYKIAKLLDRKQSPDSVKARHILIRIQQGEDTAKVQARVDSIRTLIQSKKEDFAELAKKLSDDKGSGSKGGELDWFTEGAMVPVFNDACFNGKKGDMPVVTSEFGIHLIEIEDQSVPLTKVKVAIVDRRIEPGSQTTKAAFAKASMFAGENNSAEAFDKTVQRHNLSKKIADNLKENDRFIAGLESPRELIRWSFEPKTKTGSISKVYELGHKFVIAKLAEIREKGVAPLTQKREEIEAAAKKEKKAEQIIEKFNLYFKGVSTVDAFAQKAALPVLSAEAVNFSYPNIPSAGYEPELAGTVFGIKAGKLHGPVKGRQGVFVVVVETFNEAPAVSDVATLKQQLIQDIQQRSNYELFNALKEKAEIKDYRSRFF